jgi:hypothetical protein
MTRFTLSKRCWIRGDGFISKLAIQSRRFKQYFAKILTSLATHHFSLWIGFKFVFAPELVKFALSIHRGRKRTFRLISILEDQAAVISAVIIDIIEAWITFAKSLCCLPTETSLYLN